MGRLRSALAVIALITTVLVPPVLATDTVSDGDTGASAPVAAGDLPPGGTFTDDDNNIHEGSIEAIAAAGITKGCNPPANDNFCPGDTVTRGQMAAFLHRELG